jgi:hypothetical protein
MAGRLRVSLGELLGTNEDKFLKQVQSAARKLGWRCYHTFSPKGSPKGFPDLVLVKPGHPVIFAELKSVWGKLTEAQLDWLIILSQATGVRAFLWRPDDWSEIQAVLTGQESGNAQHTVQVRI